MSFIDNWQCVDLKYLNAEEVKPTLSEFLTVKSGVH